MVGGGGIGGGGGWSWVVPDKVASMVDSMPAVRPKSERKLIRHHQCDRDHENVETVQTPGAVHMATSRLLSLIEVVEGGLVPTR